MLCVSMLIVNMLIVNMLSVSMLIVNMLSVSMPIGIILSAIMVSATAPSEKHQYFHLDKGKID